MVDIRKTRTCEKCNVQIPLDNVKLYPGNNGKTQIVCQTCLERLKNNAAKTTLSNVPKRMLSPVHNTPRALMGNNPVPAPPVKKVAIKNVLESKKAEPLQEGYRSITCVRCNYTFKIDKDRANVYFKLVCPYCGKDDKLNPPAKKLSR